MNANDAHKQYGLPQVLDSTFASRLKDDLQLFRGHPLVVTADAVERLSTLCLQVLLSAASTWAAEGKTFHIEQPSGVLIDSINLLGIEKDQLLRTE